MPAGGPERTYFTSTIGHHSAPSIRLNTPPGHVGRQDGARRWMCHARSHGAIEPSDPDHEAAHMFQKRKNVARRVPAAGSLFRPPDVHEFACVLPDAKNSIEMSAASETPLCMHAITLFVACMRLAARSFCSIACAALASPVQVRTLGEDTTSKSSWLLWHEACEHVESGVLVAVK